jgi:hypothetical protein
MKNISILISLLTLTACASSSSKINKATTPATSEPANGIMEGVFWLIGQTDDDALVPKFFNRLEILPGQRYYRKGAGVGCGFANCDNVEKRRGVFTLTEESGTRFIIFLEGDGTSSAAEVDRYAYESRNGHLHLRRSVADTSFDFGPEIKPITLEEAGESAEMTVTLLRGTLVFDTAFHANVSLDGCFDAAEGLKATWNDQPMILKSSGSRTATSCQGPFWVVSSAVGGIASNGNVVIQGRTRHLKMEVVLPFAKKELTYAGSTSASGRVKPGDELVMKWKPTTDLFRGLAFIGFVRDGQDLPGDWLIREAGDTTGMFKTKVPPTAIRGAGSLMFAVHSSPKITRCELTDVLGASLGQPLCNAAPTEWKAELGMTIE